MANKRELKKAIRLLTASLYSECVIFKELIPGVNEETAELLMDKIIVFQSEYLSRVSLYKKEAENNSAREYFHSLNSNMKSDVIALLDEINALNK